MVADDPETELDALVLPELMPDGRRAARTMRRCRAVLDRCRPPLERPRLLGRALAPVVAGMLGLLLARYVGALVLTTFRVYAAVR
jgi:hypothetical protein